MPDPYDVTQLSALRKVIAARMTHAVQTIPHFRLVADIELDELLTVRKRANDGDSEQKVSLNDCIVKACAVALLEHPAVNAQLHGSELHRYHDVDISVMVALADGVTTPIVRGANRKDVWEISAELKGLIQRAQERSLRTDEIAGGTFSVSNLGRYGVDQFDAIINFPQCAVLAVGCAKPAVTASTSGQARVATMMRATLSLDHRAIDGATGAAFLRTLREHLEQPARLFEK